MPIDERDQALRDHARHLRGWDDLSYDKIAERMGLGRTTVWRWCNYSDKVLDAAIRDREERKSRRVAQPAPVFVFWLTYTKPEGSDVPGWEPEGWRVSAVARFGERGREPVFTWTKRKYFTKQSTADRLANRLRGYGCEVTVARSNRVTWPNVVVVPR